jgi:AhpD family alkylhydroperoxidase
LYAKENLNKLAHVAELVPETMDAFFAWDKLALSDGAIPKKYKELMAIAVALSTQCPYCIELHRQRAVDAGVTESELAEVIHVAAALRAGGAITHGTHLFQG